MESQELGNRKGTGEGKESIDLGFIVLEPPLISVTSKKSIIRK